MLIPDPSRWFSALWRKGKQNKEAKANQKTQYFITMCYVTFLFRMPQKHKRITTKFNCVLTNIKN